MQQESQFPREIQELGSESTPSYYQVYISVQI